MPIDKVVVHFQRLRPEMQDVFKITLNVLQDRLSKIENSPASKILSEHVQIFRQLDAPTFYKSLVLMNRFPSLLKSSDKVYIVRENNPSLDHSPFLLPKFYPILFSMESYSSIFNVNEDYNLLTDINDAFYIYDIASVKAVHELLSLIWPEHDEYIDIIKIKSIEGALKTFRRFFMRTTAPVFDITLINNTQTTQVIHQMDVVIEKVWSEAKGLPKPEILRPIATYRFTLDFTKKVNSFSLDPQIALGTEQPVRFQIQLGGSKVIHLWNGPFSSPI